MMYAAILHLKKNFDFFGTDDIGQKYCLNTDVYIVFTVIAFCNFGAVIFSSSFLQQDLLASLWNRSSVLI